MLEYDKLFSGDSFQSHKVIVLVVKDPAIGAFLLRLLNREKRYHAFLASQEQHVFQIIQHVKTDLFVLDTALPEGSGFELYERLHAVESVRGVPAILSDFSARFPSRQQKPPELSDYDEPSEVESFLPTIQEVLA